VKFLYDDFGIRNLCINISIDSLSFRYLSIHHILVYNYGNDKKKLLKLLSIPIALSNQPQQHGKHSIPHATACRANQASKGLSESRKEGQYKE